MTLCENDAWKNAFEKNNNRKWLIAKIVNDLLHDIGHGPFSHSLEAVCELPKGFHEDIGRRLILENEELKGILNSIYPDLNQLIIEFHEKNPFGLLSTSEGQIDVDRADFLPRDEFFLDISDKHHSIDDVNSFFEGYTMGLVLDSNQNRVIRPIYKQENLENILRFLETRFCNYKNAYYNVNNQKYDYIMKAFAERLLQSNEESKLKEYLENNFRAKSQNVDLDEYIKWNDVKFLKEIVYVTKKTDDVILKKLGLMCIPSPETIENLIEGSYVSKEQYGEPLKQLDIETIETLRNISKVVNEQHPNIKLENLLVLNSTSRQDVDECRKKIDNIIGILPENEEKYGIITWEDKLVAYKNKKDEEIYIKTKKGDIKEISELVSTSNNIYAKNVLGLNESINGLIILLPILSEKSKETVLEIRNTIEEFNKSYVKETQK